MKIKSFIVLLIFALQAILLNAQFRFEHLDITDGLTENSVTDIFQDSDGFMWFTSTVLLSSVLCFRLPTLNYPSRTGASHSQLGPYLPYC